MLSHIYGWPEVRRGTERYVHELAAALRALGHDVLVVTSSADPGSATVLDVPVRRVRRGPAPVSPPSRRTQVSFAARALAPALRHRPDVWHAHSLFDGAVAASLPKVRSVFTAHGPITPAVVQRAAFRQVRRSDALVCVSEAARREAASCGVDALAVPPGVDTTAFAPGSSRAPRPVALYVGTLDARRKNVDLLLTAAVSHPDLEVWLAGPGDPAPLLAAAPAGVRDRVRHLGVLTGEDLVEAYRSAWCVALLSEREVFGMAVLEGLACGTPALVLDDGWGPAEQIGPETGVATTAGDVAEGLGRALALSRRSGTPDACRETALRYDWQRGIAPRLLEVYARG